MTLPTPSIFKNQSFQAWAIALVLVFVIVLTYDSYTGKKLLSFLHPEPKLDPSVDAGVNAQNLNL